MIFTTFGYNLILDCLLLRISDIDLFIDDSSEILSSLGSFLLVTPGQVYEISREDPEIESVMG